MVGVNDPAQQWFSVPDRRIEALTTMVESWQLSIDRPAILRLKVSITVHQ